MEQGAVAEWLKADMYRDRLSLRFDLWLTVCRRMRLLRQINRLTEKVRRFESCPHLHFLFTVLLIMFEIVR